MDYPSPEGLHLVYVKHVDGCKSTITHFEIDLDQVWEKAFVAVNMDELSKLIMKACELYPAEKLTEEELAEWEVFKQTKAGKKLCKGMYRKSATDIARHVLKEMVGGQ